LAPAVYHRGHQAVVENSVGGRLGDDAVADGTGAGPGRAADDGGGDPVGVRSRCIAEQGGVGAAPEGIDDVVPDAGDRAEGEHAAVFQPFELRPESAGANGPVPTGPYTLRWAILQAAQPVVVPHATPP